MSKRKANRAIKELNGTIRENPGREAEDQIEPNGQEPDMPEWFGLDEAEKWLELCDDLRVAGVLSSEIREAMVAYCTAYGLWIQFYRQLQEEGCLIQNTKGDVTRHPLLPEMNKQRDVMNKLVGEFGLTPAAKSKVVPVKLDEPEDPFADIVSRLTGG